MQVSDILTGVEMPHPHHEEHLCLLQNIGYMKSNFEAYKKLVALSIGDLATPPLFDL